MSRISLRRAGLLFVQLSLVAYLAACSKGGDKPAPAPPSQPAPAPNPPVAPFQNPVPEPVPPPPPAPVPNPKPENHPPKPAPKPQPTPKPQPKPQPKPEPQPGPPSPPPKPLPLPVPGKLPPAESGLGLPAWGDDAAHQAWTSAVRVTAFTRLHDLERAADREVFCPGYGQATLNQRLNCWVLVIAGVSKFESAFKTGDSFREPDGNYSVGLLALSTGECTNAPTVEQLSEAVPNLVCGTNRMATLIARDGYLDGPEGQRGAAGYWSTLRDPYKEWDPTRNRYLNLGYKNQILPLVKNYRGSKGAASVAALLEAPLDAGNPLATEAPASLGCGSLETLVVDSDTGEQHFQPTDFALRVHPAADAAGAVAAEVRAGGQVRAARTASLVTVPASASGPALGIARAMYPDRNIGAVKTVRIATVAVPAGPSTVGYTAYELLDADGGTVAKVMSSGWNYARCGR